MRDLEHVVCKIIDWHYGKGIIDGATDETQCFKMLEEMIELYCACHPDLPAHVLFEGFVRDVEKLNAQGKFKSVSEKNAQAEKIDAVGDMSVVGINILERNKTSLETCLNGVYEIISKRTGSLVNGTFVKDD